VLDLRFVQKLELHLRVNLRNKRFYLCHSRMISLLNLIVNNQENFQNTSSLYGINTMNKHYPYRSNGKMPCFQKVYAVLATKSSPLQHAVSNILRTSSRNDQQYAQICTTAVLQICAYCWSFLLRLIMHGKNIKLF
jgi:hypothetical protein